MQGQHQVRFRPNVNTPGAIVLTTAGGQTFQTQPLGLYYFDAASGQSVCLAPVQDSAGLLVPPNRVVYTNAFGALADLLYVYSTNGFEQNVVLLQAPPPPSAFGLSAATRLEVWTAFQGPPPLEQRPVVLKRETDPVLRQSMVEPDLVDHLLIFADCWFPRGTAFVADSSTLPAPGQPAAVTLARPSDTNQLFVAKKLVQKGQRTVLVESVDFQDLAPRLAALEHAALPPDPAQAGRLLARDQLDNSSAPQRPGHEPGDASRSLTRRDGPLSPSEGERDGVRGGRSTQPMALASRPYAPRGVVLDYTTLSGSASSYTFTNDATYYLPSSFFYLGSATFQPNSCVKFGSNAWLLIYGPVSFPSSGWPAVFTSKDDNAYGQTITNSTGTPSYAANPAIELYYETAQTTVNNALIRWAQCGIQEWENSGVYVAPNISSSAFQYCQVGVDVEIANDTLYLWQVTDCSVTTPVQVGSGSVSGSMTTYCELKTDKSFQGISGGEGDTFDISDTDGAVGPSNFVEIVNHKIAIYDKGGTRLAALATKQFFAVPGTGYPSNTPIDARVIYDQQSSNWVACAVDPGSEEVLFAYTTNSSPLPITNAWTKTVLYYLAKAGDNSDSPTLGVDVNGVYLSVLRYVPGTPSTIDDNIIACLPKPGVYQGSTNMTLLDTTTNDLITWKVQAAVNLDASPLGGWAWCIAKGLPVTNGSYWPGTNYYRRIQWSGAVVSWADDSWKPLSNPMRCFDFDSNPGGAPGAPQLGGTNTLSFAATGSRLQMAVIINSNLWTCQHVGLDSVNGTYSGDTTGSTVNRSGIQWWKFQLNSTGAPLTYGASGMVYDNAANNPYWLYMPSLAVNSQNVMLLGFSGSSASSYVSALYTARMADGTMMLPPMFIQAGSAYFGYPDRWGDYSYTTVDPTDNHTFWTVQGFATSTTRYNWSDWIVSVKPGP